TSRLPSNSHRRRPQARGPVAPFPVSTAASRASAPPARPSGSETPAKWPARVGLIHAERAGTDRDGEGSTQADAVVLGLPDRAAARPLPVPRRALRSGVARRCGPAEPEGPLELLAEHVGLGLQVLDAADIVVGAGLFELARQLLQAAAIGGAGRHIERLP